MTRLSFILLLLAGCSAPKFREPRATPPARRFDPRAHDRRAAIHRAITDNWMASVKEYQRSNIVHQMRESRTNYPPYHETATIPARSKTKAKP